MFSRQFFYWGSLLLRRPGRSRRGVPQLERFYTVSLQLSHNKLFSNFELSFLAEFFFRFMQLQGTDRQSSVKIPKPAQ